MEARIIQGPAYPSYHNSSLTVAASWNELIDNCIDNGATDIWIENNGTSSTIKDNGCGIKNTVEDVERFLMFHSGKNKDDESKIGCYGVGFKEATMRLGKITSVWSKAIGFDPITFDIPWYKLNYNEKILTAKGEDIGIDHGTIITIFYDDDDIKRNKNLTAGKLSFKLFDVIIKTNKLNIWSDDILYKPSVDPLFDEKIKPDIKTNIQYGGNKFDLKIGILNKNYNSLSGFYIYSSESLRCYSVGDRTLDNYNATDGLYISIGLHNTKRDWIVDKNKKIISNIDIVAKYFKEYGILDKWVAALYNGKKDETIEAVGNNLNKIFGSVEGLTGKELRTKTGENPGTKHPKNTEAKRLEAEKIRETPEGYCKQRIPNKIKGYKVIAVALDDKERFLTVNRNGNELTVVLNRSNKGVLQLLSNKNIMAVTILCYTAIQAELSEGKILFNGLVYEIFRQNENFETVML